MWAWILWGCAPVGVVDDACDDDAEGPQIVHTPLEGPWSSEEEIILSARIADPCGVFSAAILFQIDEGAWTRTQMVLLGSFEGGGQLFQGVIPRTQLAPGQLRYFLEATDAAAQNASCSPQGCDADPWTVEIQP